MFKPLGIILVAERLGAGTPFAGETRGHTDDCRATVLLQRILQGLPSRCLRGRIDSAAILALHCNTYVALMSHSCRIGSAGMLVISS